jgi:hypothetical protein
LYAAAAGGNVNPGRGCPHREGITPKRVRAAAENSDPRSKLCL